MALCPNCGAFVQQTSFGCAACGASFEGDRSWKPIAGEAAASLRVPMSWYNELLLLASPVLGLLVFLWVLSLLPGGSQTPGGVIVFFGALAPFVGAVPIFGNRSLSVPWKLLLFALYYAACAVAMFVVGWASALMFLGAR